MKKPIIFLLLAFWATGCATCEPDPSNHPKQRQTEHHFQGRLANRL